MLRKTGKGRKIGYGPAPRMEFAMLAIESTNPPPAVFFARTDSRSADSRLPGEVSKSGLSKLWRAAAESSRPTRRGMDCSRCRRPLGIGSSRSSESRSYSSET